MDYEDQLALNQEAEEINSRNESPVLEENASGEVDALETQTESTEEVETQEVESQTDRESKKSAQARIRELNSKAKQAEERAKSLEQKLAELTGTANPTPDFSQQGYQQTQFNPQEPIIKPGEELTAEELEARLQAREQRLLQLADARAELRNKQSEAINRINKEASEALQAYPELDPDSDEFNEELSETITEATEAYVRSNPYTASVKQFVAKLMKPYKGAVEKEVGKVSENIAKQVSQTALRPTSMRKAEKSLSEKTVEELEAELGIVNS